MPRVSPSLFTPVCVQPLSVERAFRAVRRSEVAVLVLDASEGVTQQDFRLAEYIVRRMAVFSKWLAVRATLVATAALVELVSICVATLV